MINERENSTLWEPHDIKHVPVNPEVIHKQALVLTSGIQEVLGRNLHDIVPNEQNLFQYATVYANHFGPQPGDDSIYHISPKRLDDSGIDVRLSEKDNMFTGIEVAGGRWQDFQFGLELRERTNVLTVEKKPPESPMENYFHYQLVVNEANPDGIFYVVKMVSYGKTVVVGSEGGTDDPSSRPIILRPPAMSLEQSVANRRVVSRSQAGVFLTQGIALSMQDVTEFVTGSLQGTLPQFPSVFQQSFATVGNEIHYDRNQNPTFSIIFE